MEIYERIPDGLMDTPDIELILVSQKRPEPRIIHFRVNIPEDLKVLIIAKIKEKFGEDIDYELQPIGINIFEYDIKDEEK